MFLPERCTKTDVNSEKPLRASDRAARTSLPSSLCGSMTLEAAVAVPLFLFFMVNILFLFDAVRLQSGLQAALQQAGEQICEAAYYTRFGEGKTPGEGSADPGGGQAVSAILSETYVRGKVISYLGDSFWKHSCVVGGRAGLSLAGSSIMTRGGRVELTVTYRVRPFIRLLGSPDFTAQARYCGHAWVGWESGEGMAESGGDPGGNSAYVTRWGEVYHTDPGCIYLNPQIRMVPASSVDACRSGDNSKYYPCETCRPEKSGYVYITKEGNRYHSDPGCGGIVRHVTTLGQEAAQSRYRPCPKCGNKHTDHH